MTWNDDVHGVVFKSNEVKLYYNGGHTWKMKLSQIAKQSGSIRIITYSLPDLEYVDTLFEKRPSNIQIICHEKFKGIAHKIKLKNPLVSVATNAEVHSKVVLIEPKTLYISSANFGDSGMHETTIGVRSKIAHDKYLENSFGPLWSRSTEIFI